jgi:hypothetical protein
MVRQNAELCPESVVNLVSENPDPVFKTFRAIEIRARPSTERIKEVERVYEFHRVSVYIGFRSWRGMRRKINFCGAILSKIASWSGSKSAL